jgi:hypothetical protein
VQVVGYHGLLSFDFRRFGAASYSECSLAPPGASISCQTRNDHGALADREIRVGRAPEVRQVCIRSRCVPSPPSRARCDLRYLASTDVGSGGRAG